MTIVSLIASLLVIGVICFLIFQLPMPLFIRNIIVGLIALALLLFALDMMGISTVFHNTRLK